MMDSTPRARVAVVAPNWLGDAVMSLPLVQALGAAPGVSVSVMAPPYTARVYAGVAGLDELVVETATSSRSARVRSRRRALAALDVDGCVLLPPSFSSALAAWLSRVGVRVGYAADSRSMLLTEAMPLPARGSEHLSASYGALGRRALERVGRPAALDLSAPRLRVFDPDEAEAASLLDDLGLRSGSYAAVVPGATYGPAKSWPMNRFRDAVRAISKDVPVLLLGGPRERDLCEAVGAGISGVSNGAGRTTLGAFFALLAGARVLVANDSGAPHAAAALGVPVVVMFGSTSPEWTRPIGGAVTVIRHPVHCSPCFRRTCPTQLECFDGISVSEVTVAALSAAAGGGAKKEVAPAHRGH